MKTKFYKIAYLASFTQRIAIPSVFRLSVANDNAEPIFLKP